MTEKRKIVALIPAAGVGSRMQASQAKQYLMLGRQTILAHSIQVFLQMPEVEKVFVAISQDDPHAQNLAEYSDPRITWLVGGDSRADSVLNGLHAITQQYPNDDVWVLVHDAARPCVQQQNIRELLNVGDNGGILAIPVVDTLKRGAEQIIAETVDRSQLWQAQTPQFFPAQSLKNALTQALHVGVAVTDEASAMEFIGVKPQLVLGRKSNLKITYPEDLALAGFYLNLQEQDNV